jgi:hypothetical protein
MKIQLDEHNYIIPKEVVSILLDKFDKINKKRLKLIEKGRISKDLPEIILNFEDINDEISEKITENEKYTDAFKREFVENKENHLKVSVGSLELPNLNDWKVLGMLEKNPETSSYTVTSFNENSPVPNSYREADPCQCDHCGYSRRRNSTFVIENTESEEIMQVGKSCMKDFVKSEEVEMLMFYSSVQTVLDEFDPDGVSGGRPIFSIHKKDYLAACNMIMRETSGFVSAKNCDPYINRPATSVGALHKIEPFYLGNFIRQRTDRYASESDKAAMFAYRDMINGLEITDIDYKAADDAIQWFKDHPPTNDSSEFEFNMHAVMTNDSMFLYRGENGRVCYALEYINKQGIENQNKLDFLKRKKETLSTPPYIGNEKGKIESLEVNLTGLDYKDSEYGTSYIYYLETRDGRNLKWSASNEGRPECLSDYEKFPEFNDLKKLISDTKENNEGIYFTIKGSIRNRARYTTRNDKLVEQTDINRVSSLSEISTTPKTDGLMHYDSKHKVDKIKRHEYKLHELKITKVLKGKTLKGEDHFCYHAENKNGVEKYFFTFDKLKNVKKGDMFCMPTQFNDDEIVGILPQSMLKIESFTEGFESTEISKIKALKYGQEKPKKQKKTI